MSSPDLITLLKRARETIADPKHWVQRFMALDEDGNNRPAHSDKAVCWCSVGAVRHAATKLAWGDFWQANAVAELAKTLEVEVADQGWDTKCVMPQGLVTTFNDERTHADVLAVFDKTIARLETQS
jgi:hypothetical protein